MIRFTETQRAEIARILEQVAEEGMPHPRHLDAALDAIEAALQLEPDTTDIPEVGED